MACGCIVIGTKTGFVLDIGKHGENMMISEPGNVDEMVNNSIIVMEDDELKRRIYRGIRDTVQSLSWEYSFNKLVEILEA